MQKSSQSKGYSMTYSFRSRHYFIGKNSKHTYSFTNFLGSKDFINSLFQVFSTLNFINYYFGQGTRVSKQFDNPRIYLTEDYWASKAAFDSYVAANKQRFDELSALHKELYEDVEHVGFF